jgi:hypothetical protein
MAQRGRKSAAELAVVRQITDHRPPPPDDLTEAQAVEWRRIVARMPGDWFPIETQPLLAALCRHIVQARSIAAMISEFRPAWAAEDGGLERLDRLGKMLDREHRAMSSLATKLRLTNQARYDAAKAARAERAPGASGKRPWDLPA